MTSERLKRAVLFYNRLTFKEKIIFNKTLKERELKKYSNPSSMRVLVRREDKISRVLKSYEHLSDLEKNIFKINPEYTRKNKYLVYNKRANKFLLRKEAVDFGVLPGTFDDNKPKKT